MADPQCCGSIQARLLEGVASAELHLKRIGNGRAKTRPTHMVDRLLERGGRGRVGSLVLSEVRTFGRLNNSANNLSSWRLGCGTRHRQYDHGSSSYQLVHLD